MICVNYNSIRFISGWQGTRGVTVFQVKSGQFS